MKTPPNPDKLFFKIGEVAELAGIEQHVLRYWEEEIESLNPKKINPVNVYTRKKMLSLSSRLSNYFMQKSLLWLAPEKN